MSVENLSIRRNMNSNYPKHNPYDPSEIFIELDSHQDNEENIIFTQVRQCLVDMKLDEKNLNTSSWSPFSEFIVPGNTVVIKPNLVTNAKDPILQDSITTHPSLVRPAIDYAWKALKGKGKIIVGDASTAEADFDALVKSTGLYDMIESLKERGVNVEIKDFRALKVKDENGIWIGEQAIKTELPEYQIINLGKDSQFFIEGHQNDKLHGGGYDIKETTKHHHDTCQEYCVSKTILNADVVISIPKLKTHRKAGMTCCLKNLVGINVDKNYLPHFAMGSVNSGGDEMPLLTKRHAIQMHTYNIIREKIIGSHWKTLGGPGVKALRILKSLSKKQPQNETVPDSTINTTDKSADLAKWLHNKLSGQSIAAGAWPGNETISRMILDLNKIFLCCNKEGTLKQGTDRKKFYIIDGVRMGMGNGPSEVIPLNLGVVAAGWNGFELDEILLELLNILPQTIPLYKKAEKCEWIKPTHKGNKLLNGKVIQREDSFECQIVPPDNWNYNTI